MKKKSIIFAAAVSAVMAMSVTAAPCAYAVKDVTETVAETTIENTKEKVGDAKEIEFKNLGKFSSHKSGRAAAVDSDGTVYYRGGDRNGSEFFTADNEGNVLNSYRIDKYKEGNSTIGIMNAEVKALDDCVLLTYEKGLADVFSMGNKGIGVIKLDKEFNEICRYDTSQKYKAFDANSEKIVTLKGKTKIYLSDIDGKNQKLVYTAGSGDGMDRLVDVAINDKYIGFYGIGGTGDDSKDYCGVIDIETGESTVKPQKKDICGLFTAGDGTFVWKTPISYENRDTRSGELYLFDGKEISTFKTESADEELIIDSDGNIFSYDFFLKNGRITFKVYKDGKFAERYELNDPDDGYNTICANGGVIAVGTTVYPEGADTGWHKVQMGGSIEYQEPFPINIRILTYSEV